VYIAAWGFAAHAFAVRDPVPISVVRVYPARIFAARDSVVRDFAAAPVEISVRDFPVRVYPSRTSVVPELAAAPVVKIPARDFAVRPAARMSEPKVCRAHTFDSCFAYCDC